MHPRFPPPQNSMQQGLHLPPYQGLPPIVPPMPNTAPGNYQPGPIVGPILVPRPIPHMGPTPQLPLLGASMTGINTVQGLINVHGSNLGQIGLSNVRPSNSTALLPPAGPALSAIHPPAPSAIRCYVGHLPEQLSDDFLKSLLLKAGKLSKWSRDKDPSSHKLASFGFAEYENAESVDRAIKLLNGLNIFEVALLLRIQDKVKGAIDDWHRDRVQEILKKESGNGATIESIEKSFDAELAKEKLEIAGLVAAYVARTQNESATGRWDMQAERNKGTVKDSAVSSSETKQTADLSTTVQPTSSRLDDDTTRTKAREVPPDLGTPTDKRGLSRIHRQHRWERARLARIEYKDGAQMKKYMRMFEEWQDEEDKRRENRKRELNIPDKEKQHILAQELRGEGRSRTIEEFKRRREKEIYDDSIDREKELNEESREGRNFAKQSTSDKKASNVEEEKTTAPAASNSKGDTVASGITLTPKTKIIGSIGKAVCMPRQAADSRVASVFGDEDEGGVFSRQHRPLTKLEKHRDVTNQKLEAEERRKVLEQSKELLSQIPSSLEDLFSYKIKWHLIDTHNVIERKLRPWVRKKVLEYMGSDESLVDEVIDYVIGRVGERPDPKQLLGELVRFLDDEGEGFVRNMWRMLIFEEMKIIRHK